MSDALNLEEAIKDQFQLLPKPVQDAITSADLEKRLRDLANTHKLHLDQWEKLENEVMMTLLGIQHVEELEQNIMSHVGIDAINAHALASSINVLVFEPIRQQLERNLEYPDAKEASVSGTESARAQALDEAHAEAVASEPSVKPATPPTATPDVKITRPTEASAYKPGEPSHARTAVHDDPYREPPV